MVLAAMPVMRSASSVTLAPAAVAVTRSLPSASVSPAVATSMVAFWPLSAPSSVGLRRLTSNRLPLPALAPSTVPMAFSVEVRSMAPPALAVSVPAVISPSGSGRAAAGPLFSRYPKTGGQGRHKSPGSRCSHHVLVGRAPI